MGLNGEPIDRTIIVLFFILLCVKESCELTEGLSELMLQSGRIRGVDSCSSSLPLELCYS